MKPSLMSRCGGAVWWRVRPDKSERTKILSSHHFDKETNSAPIIFDANTCTMKITAGLSIA
jgi:hypothetical protein